MSEPGALYAAPGSRMSRFAVAASWLWRLGEVLTEPAGHAVGMGWVDECEALEAEVRAGRLAGAVVFAPRPGPYVGSLPPRELGRGTAEFGPGEAVRGEFSLFSGGRPVVRSSLGNHAVREDRVLGIAADPDASWGRLDSYWLYPGLVGFLTEVLDRPLTLLPPVGWIRHDDLPGDAHLQAVGTAKPDRDVARRVERMRHSFESAGERLNLAISARATRDGSEVPLTEIWPTGTTAIARGVEAGTFETVCHGYTHVDPADPAGAEPREYARMDAAEAGRRVDATVRWHRETFGVEPTSFVAPNWSYGTGLLQALEERPLVAWLPPAPGPLIEGNVARETLISALIGLDGLSYRPLARLAQAGVPPTIVLHGGLFDGRLAALGLPRDAATLARLYLRRDIFRIAPLDGMRWVGANELVELLRAHGERPPAASA